MTDLTPEKVREWMTSANVDSSHRGPQMVALAEDYIRLHEEVERLRVQPSPHEAWEQGRSAGLDDINWTGRRPNPYPKPDTPPRRTLSRDEVVECVLGRVRKYVDGRLTHAATLALPELRSLSRWLQGWGKDDAAAALAKREGE